MYSIQKVFRKHWLLRNWVQRSRGCHQDGSKSIMSMDHHRPSRPSPNLAISPPPQRLIGMQTYPKCIKMPWTQFIYSICSCRRLSELSATSECHTSCSITWQNMMGKTCLSPKSWLKNGMQRNQLHLIWTFMPWRSWLSQLKQYTGSMHATKSLAKILRIFADFAL